MKRLRDIGENQLLREILPRLPQRPGTAVGPGDDCAVVRVPGAQDDWLFTTDPVIENRHFRSSTSARLIGRKAVARTVSDIAAMGGKPLWILINLVAPASTPLSRIHDLYDGMIAAAQRWNLGILGGDTAEGDALELHITAIGCVPRGTAVLRSGARARDALYVTGRLGGAWRPGCRHHLLFEPRIDAGRFLARNDFATAMIDLSDGIATDLPRLLDASKRGALLDADAIPLSRAAQRTDHPLRHALCDGEDFELLFTISPSNLDRFKTAWKQQFPRLPATRIGTIVGSPKQRILQYPDGSIAPLQSSGYQHFQGME